MKKLLLVIIILLFATNCYAVQVVGQRKVIQRRIDEVENRRKQFERDYKSGKITPETYYQVSEQMEQNKIALEGQMQQYPVVESIHITPQKKNLNIYDNSGNLVGRAEER